MNANEMTVEAVSMVAHKNSGTLKVRADGNQVSVMCVRDCLDGATFAQYNELCARVVDALKAVKARYSYTDGACELRSGRSHYSREMYTRTFQVVS